MPAVPSYPSFLPATIALTPSAPFFCYSGCRASPAFHPSASQDRFLSAFQIDGFTKERQRDRARERERELGRKKKKEEKRKERKTAEREKARRRQAKRLRMPPLVSAYASI